MFHIWFQPYLIRGAGEQQWIANSCSQLCFSGLCGAPGSRMASSPDPSPTREATGQDEWRAGDVLDEGDCVVGGKHIVFLCAYTQTCLLFSRKPMWIQLNNNKKKVLLIECTQIKKTTCIQTYRDILKLWNSWAQGRIKPLGRPQGKNELIKRNNLFCPEPKKYFYSGKIGLLQTLLHEKH